MKPFSHIASAFEDLGRRDGTLASKALFYIPLTIWCLARICLSYTSFAAYVHDSFKMDDVRMICFFILVVREIVTGKWDRLTFLSLAILGFIGLNAIPANWKVVTDTFVFVFAGRNIPFRMHAKYFLILLTSVLIVTILCSQTGILPDNALPRGDSIRHYLGFGHPNTGAAFGFFALCTYLFLRGRRIRWWELATLTAVTIVLYMLTYSRTCLACSLAAIILGFAASKLPDSISKNKPAIAAIVCIVPVLAIGSTLLVITYNPEFTWMYNLNQLLSSRPMLGHNAVAEFGISLFGQDVHFGRMAHIDLATGQWVGATSSIVVDCVYVRVLLACGLLPALALLALCCIVVWRACAENDMMLAALLIIISIYGLSEVVVIYLVFNPFLLLLGSAFACNKSSDAACSPTIENSSS